MSAVTLWLNGRTFSQEELKKGKFEHRTSFEKYTFDFCSDWLNGKTDFEIQTSGSTGTPKRISFSRNKLEASARLTATALQLKENYNSLVCLDTRYIAGQMMLVRSLVTGMNMFVTEPTSNPLASIPEKIQIDFVALVPLQLQAILDSPEASRLNTIQSIIVGGAAVTRELSERLQDYSCSFYATYGMTETISHIALQKLNGKNKQDCFYPLPSIGLKKDERGCLVIKAPHISNDELVTNDLVELQDDHSFKILGRWDNVINTGGVKIFSEAVEGKIKDTFSNLHLNNRFFVYGLPDEKLGSKVSLIVEGDAFTSSILNLLITELKRKVDRFELPKEVKFVQAFIETDTKKINRKRTVELLNR